MLGSVLDDVPIFMQIDFSISKSSGKMLQNNHLSSVCKYFDKSNTSNCSGVSSPQQWGRARFNLFHTIRVCRTSFSSLSFNPDRFWRDDWRSVGALIPWSGSRCHSKGTRPVWSAVECLSGHGSLWFPGQRENRLSCPKVPLLFVGDNRRDGLTAIDATIANWAKSWY